MNPEYLRAGGFVLVAFGFAVLGISIGLGLAGAHTTGALMCGFDTTIQVCKSVIDPLQTMSAATAGAGLVSLVCGGVVLKGAGEE